jgi:hypothetical protein
VFIEHERLYLNRLSAVFKIALEIVPIGCSNLLCIRRMRVSNFKDLEAAGIGLESCRPSQHSRSVTELDFIVLAIGEQLDPPRRTGEGGCLADTHKPTFGSVGKLLTGIHPVRALSERPSLHTRTRRHSAVRPSLLAKSSARPQGQ